jgi:MinD-like ATPase involved in chromosome partitioning or flagellar assembly
VTDWQRDVFRELQGDPRSRPDPPADAAADTRLSTGRDEPVAPMPTQPAPGRHFQTGQYGYPAPAWPGTPSPAVPASPAVEVRPTAAAHGATRTPLGSRIAGVLIDAVATSHRARQSLEVHAQLTAAVPSGRRIVVLGLRPGSGSTTVTALVFVAVAGRRSEPVLIVDAARAGMHAPLAPRLGVQPGPTLPELATRQPEISAREDLGTHLTAVGHDVWLLPGDNDGPLPPGAPSRPGPNAATYPAALSGVSRYFDIVVTDLGADAEQSASVQLLTGAHALCVVCSSSPTGIAYAETLIRSLRDAGPLSWAGRAVILANAHDEGVPVTRATRFAVRRARRAGVPIVLLPYDPALRGPVTASVASLAPRTHQAALQLGAVLLDTAVPDPDRNVVPGQVLV